uniref:Uncharacterized protein n=1 Tax=Rhizophora mucronata TaxID=61149 RepID=A0A2P2N4C9_RHIMU
MKFVDKMEVEEVFSKIGEASLIAHNIISYSSLFLLLF